MLTDATLERILTRIQGLTIGVLGDLFLDRYLDLDAGLTEPSLETGLDAYQVVRVRPSAGAAGTVINNLVALGVSQEFVRRSAAVRTPTYTKPLLADPSGGAARELNRLDIKNRRPLPEDLEIWVQAGQPAQGLP